MRPVSRNGGDRRTASLGFGLRPSECALTDFGGALIGAPPLRPGGDPVSDGMLRAFAVRGCSRRMEAALARMIAHFDPSQWRPTPIDPDAALSKPTEPSEGIG